MKCDCCGDEATIVADKTFYQTEYKALCDECFNMRFVYDKSGAVKCAQCGKPLGEEVYYDCDFDKYCSWDCIIHACGYERITDKEQGEVTQ